MKKKSKKIKIWNGRYKERDHVYIGAYSKTDACRMLVELNPYTTVNHWSREITVYFSEGCWGNDMDGIVQERGIWIVREEYTAEQTKPERIYPTVK